MDEATDYDAVNWEYNQEQIPVRRILRNYTDEQKGKPIKEEDVCRPRNGRYTEGAFFENPYGKQWKDLSWFRCPTYGNCTMCYKCGPAGKICSTCQGRDGYMIFMVNLDKIVDAEHLAATLGRGKETVRADRKVQWRREPQVQRMSGEALRIRFRLRQKQMGNPDYQRAGEQDYRRFLESIGES